MTTFKGRLLLAPVMLKLLFGRFLSTVEIGSEKGGFMGKWGVDVKFWVCDPLKGTSLRSTASFDVFCVDVRGGVLAVGNGLDSTKKSPSKQSARSRACVETKPLIRFR